MHKTTLLTAAALLSITGRTLAQNTSAENNDNADAPLCAISGPTAWVKPSRRTY
jgi:hypothetical protein